MSATMRRTATIDYRISRVAVLCKDCRQDVGLYPARHVCHSGAKEIPPPLPIIERKPQPKIDTDNNINTLQSSTTSETVERAKEAVGRGWEAVRMNWRDITARKDQENAGSRMWGKLLEATSTARQKVADKYYEVREGGNESDDDTPDNTHTQRVLAQYYLSTEGSLPPWLKRPPSMEAGSAGGHRISHSNASSGPGSSGYRAGSKPVSLQDIYDSAGVPDSKSRYGRTQDLQSSDSASSGRQPLVGDRLRRKLRPSNARPSARPGDYGDQYMDTVASTPGGGGYSGRTGFSGGDDYDPFDYRQQGGQPGRSADTGQGRYK